MRIGRAAGVAQVRSCLPDATMGTVIISIVTLACAWLNYWWTEAARIHPATWASATPHEAQTGAGRLL
jgi:hypothetical protein